jgi:hypothetical protein
MLLLLSFFSGTGLCLIGFLRFSVGDAWIASVLGCGEDFWMIISPVMTNVSNLLCSVLLGMLLVGFVPISPLSSPFSMFLTW